MNALYARLVLGLIGPALELNVRRQASLMLDRFRSQSVSASDDSWEIRKDGQLRTTSGSGEPSESPTGLPKGL